LNSGTATYATSTLTVGTHPITATFTPTSAGYVASTSSVVAEVIQPKGFTIALAPTTLMIVDGGSGTGTILLTSFGDFAGPLALTYGTLPENAAASITPATVTLTVNGSGSSTLTLNTLFQAANNAPSRPGAHPLPAVLDAVLLALIPLGLGRRKRLARILSIVVMAIGLQTLTGCTNVFYYVNTVAPGTYQLPITATDANHNTQTAVLTVVVTR
jgi:hypothetical protein